MLRQFGKRFISAVLNCCLLLTCLSGCSSEFSLPFSKTDNSDTAAGLAYLQSLDQIDVAAVEETLALQHQQNFEAMHDEHLRQLEDGEVSCWSLFEDYLLCGDSRFVAISYDGLLPESNVWAEYGTTIDDLEEMIPDIVAAAPARLFVDYGMNDFCSGVWNDPDIWAQSYADIICTIQAQLPDLKVYVCSLLPASDALTQKDSLWTLIPDYSEALANTMTGMKNVCYIDCSDLTEGHQDLFQSDGKHFVKEFYEYWGNRMIMAMFDYEFDDGSSADPSEPVPAEPVPSEPVPAEPVPSAQNVAAPAPAPSDPQLSANLAIGQRSIR